MPRYLLIITLGTCIYIPRTYVNVNCHLFGAAQSVYAMTEFVTGEKNYGWSSHGGAKTLGAVSDRLVSVSAVSAGICSPRRV